MPINAHPDYLAAEKEHLLAQTMEDKLKTLNKMISLAPKHKGAENLRQQLTTKRKKLKEKIAKAKKSGKSQKTGIKKHEMQAVLIGLTNSGKSALLSLLTNAQPKISENKFTTNSPIIGMMNYAGTNIQLIENPSIKSGQYSKGLTNTADTLLILITNLEQLKEIEKNLDKSSKNKIIIFNKTDLLSENEQRKTFATLSSRKYNFVLISTVTLQGIPKLKEKLFKSFNKIRVYTKEPGKEKSSKPVILNPNSTIKDVAEKILHGFSNQIKQTKIWGPSSKFPGQSVGLQHKLKDLDVVEFKTK